MKNNIKKLSLIAIVLVFSIALSACSLLTPKEKSDDKGVFTNFLSGKQIASYVVNEDFDNSWVRVMDFKTDKSVVITNYSVDKGYKSYIASYALTDTTLDITSSGETTSYNYLTSDDNELLMSFNEKIDTYKFVNIKTNINDTYYQIEYDEYFDEHWVSEYDFTNKGDLHMSIYTEDEGEIEKFGFSLKYLTIDDIMVIYSVESNEEFGFDVIIGEYTTGFNYIVLTDSQKLFKRNPLNGIYSMTYVLEEVEGAYAEYNLTFNNNTMHANYVEYNSDDEVVEENEVSFEYIIAGDYVVLITNDEDGEMQWFGVNEIIVDQTTITIDDLVYTKQ